MAPVAEALARGDRRAATAALMRRFGPELLRFCVSMLGDRDLADDVHQAVFVAAFEDLGDLADPGKARAWLYGIARHRCLDAAKKRRRFRFRFLLSADAGEAEVAPAEVHEMAESDGRITALLDCVRRLPAHVRVAVLLRYQENLPYQEIARMSRETPSALQMRVARALETLRNCLGDRAEVAT